MGLFDRLRNAPDRQAPNPPAPDPPAPPPEDAFAPYLDLALSGADIGIQRTALIDGFLAYGVDAETIPRVMASLRDGIALLSRGDNGRRSRICGDPPLPPDTPWPHGPDGRPLTFIATFDLDELPQFAPHPDNGRLLVYWSESSYEFEHVDFRAGTRVFWVPGRVAPVAATAPDGAGTYAAVPVTGVIMPILGGYEQLLVPGEDDDDQLFEAHDAASLLYDHQLLGPSRDIQGPVLEEVGYWFEHSVPRARDDYTPDEVAGKGWMLLAQIETTDDLLFGDAGALYLVIPEVDIEARRFDRVMGIMQCA